MTIWFSSRLRPGLLPCSSPSSPPPPRLRKTNRRKKKGCIALHQKTTYAVKARPTHQRLPTAAYQSPTAVDGYERGNGCQRGLLVLAAPAASHRWSLAVKIKQRNVGQGWGVSRYALGAPATTSTASIRQLLGAADANGTPRHIQHSPGTPTTGLRERGNDTSRSTGRSGRQNEATRRNMRRDERVTIQGPVKEQQPDGMSHRGGEAALVWWECGGVRTQHASLGWRVPPKLAIGGRD